MEQDHLEYFMADIYFSNPKPGAAPQGGYEPVYSKKPGRSGARKFFLAVVSLLLIAAVALGGPYFYIYSLMDKTDYNRSGHKPNVYVDSSDLMRNDKVVNILFIGVDAREQDLASRSDTMLLFSIDKINKKIKLTSFMRDTWVDIPGSGYAKLNAACTYGGAQLVMDTIEYNFNVEIDHYVLVDFDSFVKAVNGLGGVDVEITESEAKYLRDKVHLETIQAGESVHLNGNQALWYCRIRKLDSDFMRTKRQRKVITSLVGKAREESAWELTKLVKSVLPNVETDMNPMVLTNFAFGAFFRYVRYDLEQARVPADGTWQDATIKGQMVLKTDLGENRDMLEDFLYAIDEETASTETQPQ
ncbi:MAG TPA: LCP family protein [Clostridiales bacterium]|nr:LCP family protein [Clostridiales bacterium]